MTSSRVGHILLVGIAGVSLGYWLREFLASQREVRVLESPRSLLLRLAPEDLSGLPFPPQLFPGARAVETPYGVIQVYEWGPDSGQKVLLLPGIGTPVMALGNVADELVAKGYRVMVFDLFGRGWSDGVEDIPYDSRLYITQILLVLASSPLPWTGQSSFHLLGYSLGGGVAAAFTRYFPHLVRSLTLVAPGGLIRSKTHVSWRSRFLYSRGIFPQWLLKLLVTRRLRPPPPPKAQAKPLVAKQLYNSDASGGDDFDYAVVSKRKPDVTVASVFAWQLDNHPGFVPSFMGTIRDGPIYDRVEIWTILGRHLAVRRAQSAKEERKESHPSKGKVLVLLGANDTVIVKDEFVADARAILGEDAIEVVTLDGGHEVIMTRSSEIASAMAEFIRT